MERHERYDPEDIESLLSERGFDELLPDERAFVLRHMSGRDEYERMRALLHYVRPDERDRSTIEPEDRVRTNVLATFRAHQQPQWRIWLNGISLWLAPKEASAHPLWRPALAFGSLALLIVAGVVAVRQFDGLGDNAAVAELKQEESAPAPPPSVKLEDQPTVQPAEEVKEAVAANSSVEQLQMLEVERAAGLVAAEPVLDMEARDAAAAPSAVEDLAFDTGSATFLYTAPQVTTSGANGSTPLSDSHVVTVDELSRNMSSTNVVGEIAIVEAAKATGKRSKVLVQADKSRSLAEDPAILSLVTAGW
ncbi:MAG TPA: hypothetical protein PLR96_09205 [Flavobacteriales bacterium]|nr:hypothetical protein [Flavobacteriales bacterium]